MKHRELRHNLTGINLLKNPDRLPVSICFRTGTIVAGSEVPIKSLLKAPAAAHRMLALLLVVFSGIIPNGVAHRLVSAHPSTSDRNGGT